MKKIILGLSGALVNFLIFSIAFAATSSTEFTIGLPLLPGKSSYSSFGDYFTDLMTVAIEVAGVFAVGVVVYAGYLYTTSQGDAQRINTAKELVTGSFIGIAILLLIRLILPTLNITGFS